MALILFLALCYFLIRFDKAGKEYEQALKPNCPPHQWITKGGTLEDGLTYEYLVCDKCRYLGNNPDNLYEEKNKDNI